MTDRVSELQSNANDQTSLMFYSENNSLYFRATAGELTMWEELISLLLLYKCCLY